jgi:hypothetical protein
MDTNERTSRPIDLFTAGQTANDNGDFNDTDDIDFLFKMSKSYLDLTGDKLDGSKELMENQAYYYSEAVKLLKGKDAKHEKLRWAYGGFTVSAARKLAKDLLAFHKKQITETMLKDAVGGKIAAGTTTRVFT